MNTLSPGARFAKAVTVVVLLGVLWGCGKNKDDEIGDVRVVNAEPIITEGQQEDFPLPNCGGTGELKQVLGNQTSVKHSLSLGSKASLSGGGEVSLPQAIKLKLEAEIELAYQQIYETANSRLDSIELKAAPGSHVIYVIQWEEQTYSSTVYFTLNGKLYEVPYTYILRIPKTRDSRSVACPPSGAMDTPVPVMIDRSALIWDYGLGYQGDFDIPTNNAEPVRITAYAHSWPNFPRIRYTMPGEYEVFVQVRISPGAYMYGHFAGLGIVSEPANKIVLLGRSISPGGEDVRALIYPLDDMSESNLDYLGDQTGCIDATTEVKIIKRADLISLYCSADGQNWLPVREQYKLQLGDDTQVFLFAYSVDDEPVEANFYEFRVAGY